MEFCSDDTCWQYQGSCSHFQMTTSMASLRPPCPSCEAAGPAKFCDYKFAGEFSTLKGHGKTNSTEMYTTRSKDKPQAGLVIFTDVFGIKSPQVQYVADQLAKDGYLVVVPDFFTPTFGRAWDFADMPAKDPEEFKRYFATINDMNLITPLAEGAVGWLKEQGVDKIGCVGFCWGGVITIRLAGQPLSMYAAASVHPALTATKQEDYDAMKIPLLFCPSNGESQAHIDQVNAALQRHPMKEKCVFKFFNVKHGYCATRGDWANNTAEREAAAETIAMISKFFKSSL